LDFRPSNPAMHDRAALAARGAQVAPSSSHLKVLDRRGDRLSRFAAPKAVDRAGWAWPLPSPVPLDKKRTHGRAVEKGWTPIVDRGQAMTLPVPDGVFANAQTVSQLTSSVAPVDLDPVWVNATTSH
jgi:hypothetical protein